MRSYDAYVMMKLYIMLTDTNTRMYPPARQVRWEHSAVLSDTSDHSRSGAISGRSNGLTTGTQFQSERFQRENPGWDFSAVSSLAS